MTALREQIWAGLEAALQAGTGAAEIERMPSGDPGRFPALHLHDDGHAPEPETEAFASRYRMAGTIEGFVEGAGGAATHAQLNALYAAMLAAIIAFADSSAFIETIDEGAMRVAVAKLGSTRRLAFSHDFELTYVTPRGAPDFS